MAQTAQIAEAAHDWNTAFSALDTLLRIHPGDADLRGRQAVARAGVLAEGLAGTVYSIADGPGAGLYANLPAVQAVRLPNSDGLSRPRAWQAVGSALVYDQPRLWRGQQQPGDSARESVLARVQAANGLAASTQPDLLATQRLPPAILPSMHGVFTADSLFWPTFPRDDGIMDPLLTVYHFADGTTQRISTTRGSRYLGALDAAQGRILLVDPPSNWDQPSSRLILGRPGEPPIYSADQPGWLLTAQFAADGRHLLITMQEGSADRGLTRRVYLVHISTANKDRPASTRWELLREQRDPPGAPSELHADFVPAGDGRSHTILLWERDRTTLRLTVHATGSSETVLWQGAAPQWAGPYTFSPDGRWLAYVSGETGGGRLVVQRLVAGSVPQMLNGAAFRSGAQLDFAPDSRHLVYRTSAGTPGAAKAPVGTALYGVPLDEGTATPTGGPLHPHLLGTVAEGPAALALPPSGRLLLYLDPNHTPHAVAYDGTLDVALPGPVAGVWSLR